MKKSTIFLGTLVLVIASVCIGITLFIANKQLQESDEAKAPQKTNVLVEEAKADNSRYLVYSKVAYENAVTQRRVLFFYATWCPSCKQADEDFTANSDKIPDDVVVLRVNYNDPNTDQEEKDLAKKYGITYQHTFVQVDEQGNEITKWNGGQTNELLTRLK